MTAPVHIPDGAPHLQRWDDPRHGRVAFRLLVDGDGGPSRGIVQGIAYFGAGDREKAHSHDRPETVHVLSGAGRAEVEGRALSLSAGDTVFVPAGISHAWSAPDGDMTILFTFPADRLAEVAYRFDETT